MNILWIVFVPFFFFFMAIFGVFRRPCNCPECGERLSPWQNPFKKTRRQWLYGGYTCRKCGCEVDLEGNVVSKTNRFSLPFVVGMTSLLFVLVGIGCVLSMALMRHSHVSSLAAAPIKATPQVRPLNDHSELDALPVIDIVPEK
ncbi:MAG: hypothetical protein WCH39_02515 [Schlesneria sp.]